VLSAPSIEEAITGGQFQITGGAAPFTADQARELAIDLGGS
jgi:preprotein translocase subunit SecD